jgi:DNA-binding NtrC family response regulator
MSGAETVILSELNGKRTRKMRPYQLSCPSLSLQRQIVQPSCRIGSHQGNDLVLDDPSVSRFHLEIEATPIGYRIRDLGSTNGTRIGDLRLTEVYVSERTELQLGNIALELTASEQATTLPASDEEQFHGVLGQSPLMRELFAQLDRVAPARATVLLEGESGTGKERVAAAIHQASGRKGAFVVLDCAAIPEALMESELFGHERGAFTGAVAAREGRMEEADGGTLFLDEIGELPLDLQPKLLRALEQRQVRRLGGATTKQVDLRVVCATNRNLAQEVNRGTFREDLYYRLAVIKLRVPPLRERPEDIRPLVTHFARDLLRDQPRRAEQLLASISPANWSRLEALPWAGNVRELRNFIERTLILSDEAIHSTVIPATEGSSGTAARPAEGELFGRPNLDRPFSAYKAELISDFERAYLLGQLARHDNNVSAAARAAGMDRMNFKRLLRKYR